ncbi:MAG TPA: DUF2232 domain-containing protein [Candidatus Saccharimonadaceae bacterium]|nr:DUF2232 domain-containing protein [Candidatus Saccharimonadaceae bacterium]
MRAVLLILLLAALALQMPLPWGGLWLLVPLSTAIALLTAWRFGAWSIVVPVLTAAFAVAFGRAGSPWAWWLPAGALSGMWMGLREEGGGPTSGERAWMLAPLLVLAAALPWLQAYAPLVASVETFFKALNHDLVETSRQVGYTTARLQELQRTLDDGTALGHKVLPLLLPSVLFLWVAVLVSAGRAVSARAARVMGWPTLSRGRLRDWRLPDGALWVFLLGLALLVAQWPAWMPTGWTLLLSAGLGFCVQGIAVVESWMLARGVPASVIVLTLLFVFTVATPAFVMAAAAVGLSDAWLDYRRLEPVPEQDPKEEP